MSIKIRIQTGNTLISTGNIVKYIDVLETSIIEGSELSVFLYDPKTTNFHLYEYEYSIDSEQTPRFWIINNIFTSITCSNTTVNMEGLFDDVKAFLKIEYGKLVDI